MNLYNINANIYIDRYNPNKFYIILDFQCVCLVFGLRMQAGFSISYRQGGQKVGQNLCNYLIYISLQRLSLIC